LFIGYLVGTSGPQEECDDLFHLEPLAMMGAISDGQAQCLEERYAADETPNVQAKVSHLLLANAWGAQRESDWEKLALRHLSEIGQSDPEICFKYAQTLSKQGDSRANEVIRWVEVADQNQSYWTGKKHTSRVYGLHRMRTAATQSLWQAADGAHTTAPTSETEAHLDSARARTKLASRAWYEFAQATGQDATLALAVCENASDTAGYCQAG
jgi:hypothetical protein